MKSGNISPGVIVITQGAGSCSACSALLVGVVTKLNDDSGGSGLWLLLFLFLLLYRNSPARQFFRILLGGWLVLGMLSIFVRWI